jgi:hypothetical protein
MGVDRFSSYRELPAGAWPAGVNNASAGAIRARIGKLIDLAARYANARMRLGDIYVKHG